MKNIMTIVLAVFLIGVIMSSIFLGLLRKKKINDCSIEVFAKVVERKKKRKKNDAIKYIYTIDNQTYSWWVNTAKEIFPGDSIKIEYACEKPEISRIID